MSETTTQELQGWLDRLRDGDQQARDALVALSCQRLTALTRKMFHDYAPLRPWMQTDDVFQNATMRLHRSLADISPPTVREFYGLAALQIRRELRDLVRHYYGRPGEESSPDAGGPALPRHSPAHVAGRFEKKGDDSIGPPEPMAPLSVAGNAFAWEEFHKSVEELPAELREAFDLLWYQELTVNAAAEVLQVDERTVKRRMAKARIKLAKVLKDWLPEK